MVDPILSARVEALIARAHRDVWSPRTDIDWWGHGPVVPEGYTPARYVDTISQLFHAEQAALAIATGLRGRLGDPTAEAFLATQIAAEDRHAQVLRGYLERLGDVAPVDPNLAVAYARARAWTGPAWVAVAALDVLLAHELMPLHHRRLARWRCPLLRQIDARIARDDERHAAFGLTYLEHALPRADAAARAAGLGWLAELWTLGTVAVRARTPLTGAALHPDRSALAVMAAHAIDLFRRLGLMVDTPVFA